MSKWLAVAVALVSTASAAGAQNEAWDPRFDAGGMGGHVRAIAIAPNGHVFAGGLFTTAGGVPANRVAEWDGGAWSALGGNGESGDVYAVAVDSRNNVYVGGKFTTAGGSLAGRVAMWDGGSWTGLDGGVSDEVYALAVDADDNLYAGGKFTVAGGVTAARVAMWDGSVWTDLDGGTSGEVRALAADGTVVYAGGLFTVAGGTAALRVARWDGASWSALGSGVSNDVLALAVAENGDLYAGGRFTTAGGALAGRIARWNGSAWSDLDGGASSDVYTIATSGTDVYAGGIFTTAGGAPAFRIAKWTGGSWSNLGDGVGEPVVWAAAVTGEDLYVGGEFTTAGGKTSLYIGRYNPDIVPVFVQAFSAHPREDRVELRWQIRADEAVAGYRVYRAGRGDGPFLRITRRDLPTGDTGFADTEVLAGVTYHYRLGVVTPDGSETFSRTVEARVPRSGFMLEQNSPNPFNPITTIRLSGPGGRAIRVAVYDVHGEAVVTLFDGVSPGGTVDLQWNGRDAAGQPVGSGVYFYRLETGGRTITRKMLLIK